MGRSCCEQREPEVCGRSLKKERDGEGRGASRVEDRSPGAVECTPVVRSAVTDKAERCLGTVVCQAIGMSLSVYDPAQVSGRLIWKQQRGWILAVVKGGINKGLN